MEALKAFDKLEGCIASHCKKEDRAFWAHYKKHGPTGEPVDARMACLHKNCRVLIKATLAAMIKYYKNSVVKHGKLLEAEKDAVRRKWTRSILDHAKSQLALLSKIDPKNITVEDVKKIMLGA